MSIKSSYSWCIFLVLVALVFVLHVKAREIPQPKITNNNNNTNQNKEEVIVGLEKNTNNNTLVKDAPKKGDEVKDDKHFIAFAGMGAAGGVGGAAGIIPIDFNGLGTIPTFGGPGLGGGVGGASGGGGIGGGGIGGGGAGGGCPSSSTGGLVPIP